MREWENAMHFPISWVLILIHKFINHIIYKFHNIENIPIKRNKPNPFYKMKTHIFHYVLHYVEFAKGLGFNIDTLIYKSHYIQISQY
jgi:hypothetical protein